MNAAVSPRVKNYVANWKGQRSITVPFAIDQEVIKKEGNIEKRRKRKLRKRKRKHWVKYLKFLVFLRQDRQAWRPSAHESSQHLGDRGRRLIAARPRLAQAAR